jgi:hypothetical protein
MIPGTLLTAPIRRGRNVFLLFFVFLSIRRTDAVSLVLRLGVPEKALKGERELEVRFRICFLASWEVKWSSDARISTTLSSDLANQVRRKSLVASWQAIRFFTIFH